MYSILIKITFGLVILFCSVPVAAMQQESGNTNSNGLRKAFERAYDSSAKPAAPLRPSAEPVAPKQQPVRRQQTEFVRITNNFVNPSSKPLPVETQHASSNSLENLRNTLPVSNNFASQKSAPSAGSFPELSLPSNRFGLRGEGNSENGNPLRTASLPDQRIQLNSTNNAGNWQDETGSIGRRTSPLPRNTEDPEAFKPQNANYQPGVIRDAEPVIHPEIDNAFGSNEPRMSEPRSSEPGIGGLPYRNGLPQTASAMWWEQMVANPLSQKEVQQIAPDLLIQLALQNSPKILATSKRPLIQETEILQAEAEFDADLFLRTQFDDRNDPVGNELTTGGQPFLKDHIWYSDAGLQRRLTRGGEVELKQRLGFQNSNSRFFVPQDQGTATLSLNFTQPLMKGRGEYYNRSQILIAQLGNNASWDQFAGELQDELTKIVDAYWTLYYNRAVLLQKQYNVERGAAILAKLEGRSGLDSLPSQIARARAAVQSRRTELANAARDVQNAETDIRRLIGSQEALMANAAELIPMESPVIAALHTDLESVIQNAMTMRPEVKQALKRARIAAVQRNVTEHELMPELNLIFNSYVSALRGETDIPGAWTDQFQATTPGYAVGFEFSMPYARRAARARNQRQQLIMEQVRHEIDQTVFDVVAEAQLAWRQVDSAFQTIQAAEEAIAASRSDLLQNEARWESFAMIEGDLTEGQSPTTLLDQLLDAQQRLTNAELTYSQAVLEFKTAEIALKKATGTLMSHDAVNFATQEESFPPAVYSGQ